MGDAFRILLRSAGELFYRSSCVKAHLRKVRRIKNTQYKTFANTIIRDLEGIEQNPLDTLAEEAISSDVDRAEILRTQLSAFSMHFKQFHEMLMYLPRHNVLPETIDCLKIVFANEYRHVRPSVILGTLFNAYEYDFLAKVKDFMAKVREMFPVPSAIWPAHEKNIALQLPVCDRYCPTAWGVLFHEMGHALDSQYGISNSVTAELGFASFKPYVRWAAELSADMIAAHFLGPASILPIIAIEQCLCPAYAIYTYSATHPSTADRLRVVSEYLESMYGFNWISEECKGYKELWEDNLRQFVPAKDEESIRNTHQVNFETVISRIASELSKKVASRWPLRHEITKENIVRCMKRLRKSLPIGAQGQDRALLRNELLVYEKMAQEGFKTTHDKYDAFEALKSKFQENPLPIPSLLLSCAKRREELFSEFVDSWSIERPRERIEQLCKDLSMLDRLGIQSMQASTTRRELHTPLSHG